MFTFSKETFFKKILTVNLKIQIIKPVNDLKYITLVFSYS